MLKVLGTIALAASGAIVLTVGTVAALEYWATIPEKVVAYGGPGEERCVAIIRYDLENAPVQECPFFYGQKFTERFVSPTTTFEDIVLQQ